MQVGAAIVATRFVIGATTPAALALLRHAIALACLAPFVPLVSLQRIARLGEAVTPWLLLGLALIVAGLWTGVRSSRACQ